MHLDFKEEPEKSCEDPREIARKVSEYFKNHPEKLVSRHRYRDDLEKLKSLIIELQTEGKIIRFL